MFSQKLIKMKPLILSMAASVLMLISLASQRNENVCNTVSTGIERTENLYHSGTENSAASNDVVNFSGKNMNFFLVSF
jgi:hypothetical protein